MTAHPDTLGLMDRAKRLIDENNPPDQSPLTTASRDIREARAAIAELIAADKEFDEAVKGVRNCRMVDFEAACDRHDAAQARRASALAALENQP